MVGKISGLFNLLDNDEFRCQLVDELRDFCKKNSTSDYRFLANYNSVYDALDFRKKILPTLSIIEVWDFGSFSKSMSSSQSFLIINQDDTIITFGIKNVDKVINYIILSVRNNKLNNIC